MKNNEKAKTAAALKIENAGLRAQLKVLRDIRRTEGYVAILQSIIRWSALTTMCYFAYRAIEVIAGQSTFASVAVDLTNPLILDEPESAGERRTSA
jgi:hypothetical protein